MPIDVLEPVVLSIVAAFGLVWGSYLNVVVYRLPLGLSTAVPGSHCPRCVTRIMPWDNVPVASYLFLGGRCRACSGRISLRYPAVEATTALLFVLAFRRFAEPATILASATLAFVLLALALIDLDHRGLPVELTLPTLVAGLLGSQWLGWTTPLGAVLGAVAGGGALWVIARIWRRIAGVDGFGPGDVHLMAALGACFGLEQSFRVFFMALLGAALVGGVLSLAHRLDRHGSLPFGSFLSVAALFVLLVDPAGVGV